MTPAPPAAPTTLVVAVDGTSGSGKSSTCRAVAEHLSLRYLDTGAMFRAMTWWLLRNEIDVYDGQAVASRVWDCEILVGTDPSGPAIMVDGVDVALAIRTDEVNAAVSPVSAVPEVRARLLVQQRTIIGDGGIVVEGRDIGSVVAPSAQVKIYLTADPEARAARRAAEAGSGDLVGTRDSLLRRDQIDSKRATAPLMAADGSVHVDSTYLSLEQVVAQIVALAEDVAAQDVGARDVEAEP